MAYSDSLKSYFPAYDFKKVTGSLEILEPDKGAKVRRVVWNYPSFQVIDPAIIKEFTSLYDKGGSRDIFRKDCDGIFICEHEGNKYFIFNELKSTFDTSDIYKAKKQIISSYLKMNLLMHLAPGYRNEDFRIKGFIFSHPPHDSFINDLKDKLSLPRQSEWRKDAEFVSDLIVRGKNIFQPLDFSSLKGLQFGDRGIFNHLELYYIPVPKGCNSLSLNLLNFL